MKAIFFLFFLGFAISGCESPKTHDLKESPVDLVNPLVDAANSRWFFFNSATRPFGMVNLSPDNILSGAWGSGYRYNTDTIRTFSHVHAWQLSSIPVMPISGDFNGSMGPEVYKSKFSHDKEVVKAGYHKVELEKYGIQVELTSTKRVGFHRYTFPKSKQNHIVIDLAIELGPSETESGLIKRISNTELEGYAVMASTRRRPKPVEVYYVIQFDKPFSTLKAWQDGAENEVYDSIKGHGIRGYVTFESLNREVRQMKVGLSYVSSEQARKNLNQELPHWDFKSIVDESRNEWNDILSKIEVKGGNKEERSRFYTDLWHALQGRRIISDVDGMYCDRTGDSKKIKQIPLDSNNKPLFNHYNSDSFWGAQWTLNTLWHLVYPKISEEFIQSMLLMYKDGGLIPRGPSGGNYTYVMTGATSTPFIISAYMKGIRNFDIGLAYEGMRKNHFPGGLMSKAGYEHNTFIGGGLEHYIKKGYIPYPLPESNYPKDKIYGSHQDGAGQTLEYAYQDWSLAQMAKSLDKNDDYNLFLERSNNYKNLFDSKIGWMRVRTPDGSWQEPFEGLMYNHGWVEANAVQSTWFVPHDVDGLIQLMGGRQNFNDKLNRSFEIASQYDFKSSEHGDRTGVTGNNLKQGGKIEKEKEEPYLNYGNQPSMQAAYLFNYSGSPWLTQYWAREVIEKVYSGVSPFQGYSGDEDQGLMGALSVLMKMGIFSMRGGTAIEPVYEISSPIFTEIVIHLDENYFPGKTFVIQSVNNSKENRYIQSASLNGDNLSKPWFFHKELIKGGILKLEMGDKPNKNWGNAEKDVPPSMSNELK
ncbi:MAG: putative alpha-1,2-mannosidase [bacterium]|jgi:predicted alpha-1,2-mannosidase